MTPVQSLIPVMMVVAIIGIGVLLMISVRRKIADRNEQRPSARELIEQLKAPVTRATQHASHDSADVLETAQRVGAQLDNKARRLEVLIAEADQRIAALSSSPETGAPKPLESQPTTMPAPTADALPGQSPHSDRMVDSLTLAVYEKADAGRNPVEIARELEEQVGKVELILALRS